MWKGSEDPGGPPEGGGSADPPKSSHQLQDLKDQFEQQQLLITQLKEIIKKTDQTQSTVTQEKVAEYANTLTKMKSRAKRHSQVKEGDTEVAKLNSPASEKIMLLRQQLEQNKVKLAERGKNQKGIEDMVTQIKAQLDDSQQQINLSQTPLNISLFEDRVDYSPQLSSQELYSILLNKDKLISELNGKVSKLQANVLDLQENVKEKDSVIDARTKAITLMSENLSKKGKNTLDALEETKEQMRHMQGNFIELEEQLKGDNASMKSELEAKTRELQRVTLENEELTMKYSELEKTEIVLQAKIVELEKSVSSSPNASPSRRSPSKSRKSRKGKFPSKAGNDDNTAAIADLEKQLDGKTKEVDCNRDEIERLKKQQVDKLDEYEVAIKELKQQQEQLKVEHAQQVEADKRMDVTVTDGNGEVGKLKQQLDEANKHMIRVKAQHKSKLKELNKKIDAFKRISDVNAELVKVENENSKLHMKIAELEEEKGQMQLTMVESRESTSADELEATIKELTAKLDEQQVTITNQEAENAKYQEDLKMLQEKLEKITNDEVKSELSSVQFEEQLEKLEQERKTLQQEIEGVNNEVDTMKKDKVEQQHKYESLLQENAELIDRLEKLSTEKVSSAESIEMVENLTQQEKLELEAYQQSLLPKTSMENLDENPELNDSVNQLTEETSELLQKIELFTIERREVMEKLELLTDENNQLNLKLKEVENNRDVLAETYEQLQTEKEVLDSKLEEYEVQLSNREEKETQVENKEDVEEYKMLVQIQKDQINDLKLKLLSYESTHDMQFDNAAKEALEGKYLQLIAENEELLAQMNDLKETNDNYNEIIEGNKQELIKYAKLIDENRNLQSKHEELTVKESRLVEDYEKELDDKCQVIKQLESEMKAVNEAKLNVESSLAEKQQEIESVKLEKQQKEIENEKLVKATEKEELEAVSSFQVRIKELETKNKEQLEKMKKIAANLKKKTVDYKDLEAKYNEITQKQNIESEQEKLEKLQFDFESNQNELQLLRSELNLKNDECNLLGAQMQALQQENNQIKTRNEEITNQLHTYSSQIEDLQNIIAEYEGQVNTLRREIETLRGTVTADKSDEKDATIRRLNEEIEAQNYNAQSSNNALQMKIHEQELCIETQELEVQNYKEQVSKLEEDLAVVEERRQSLERMAIDLGHELDDKKTSVLKAAENEDFLESRLKQLAEKERIVELKLEEAQEENVTLQSENKQLTGEVDEYKKQVNAYNLKLKEYDNNQEMLSVMETEKQELEVKHKNLENEVKKLNMDLTMFQAETDKTETELQEQLERYANERKQLLEQFEMSREEIVALSENKIEFQQTIEDLNSKLDQQQVEFEDTINKYHELQQEHKKTLTQLENVDAIVKHQEQQLVSYQEKEREAEVESPGAIEELFARKKQELEDFKKNYVPSPADFFSENEMERTLMIEVQELQRKVQKMQWERDGGKEKENAMKMQELERELQTRIEAQEEVEGKLLRLQDEVAEKNAQLSSSEGKLRELGSQLDFARNMLEQVDANNFQTVNRNHELEQQLSDLKQQSTQIIVQKEDAVAEKSVDLFKWPEADTDDPFAFVQEQAMVQSDAGHVQTQATQESNSEKKQAGNTQEELLQKIKTLEFMLFNTEQEKENALIQCSQLSEVLGRFIYDNEQQQMASQASNSNITSSITTESNIESQIVSGDEISLPPQIPYEKSKDPQECSSSQSMLEDMCMQKKAYECNPSAFADDDGWGFDVEESKLDEAHMQAVSGQLQDTMQMNVPVISELEDRVRVLQLERETHLEQIHQANVKSGKLIKKLKEFKARNEQLVGKLKAKSTDDFGLEDAIQEELKSQIASLEKKIKETSTELEKEKAEREGSAKRIDVLAAANERLVEMKEKQDIEVMGYQQQNRELQLKLEKVAWSSDSSEQIVSTSSNTNSSLHSLPGLENYETKLNELNDTIKELTLDNEELQMLLEEQMHLRKDAESRSKSVPTDIDQTQLKQLIEEKSNLISLIAVYENDKESMKCELERLKESYEKACVEKSGALEELSKRNDRLQENYMEKTQLEASLLENGIVIDQLRKDIDDLNSELQDMQSNSANKTVLDQMNIQLNAYQDEVAKLRLELETVQSSNSNLEVTIVQLQKEKEHIQQEIGTLQAAIDGLQNQKEHLQENNTLLGATINELRGELQEKVSSLNKLQSASDSREALIQEIADLKQNLSEQEAEFALKLTTTTDQLVQQWSQHVDQRGNDVAESWKLHVDTRENEFMQLEQSLRKELNESEEKCNVLVNENNELRRNVDAEIRNEVDRISALQQQINDRQTHIAKLSEALQQKDADIERMHNENTNVMKQLNEYEGRMNTSSEELMRLMQRQEEKNKIIEDLSAQLQFVQDNDASDELMDTLRKELAAKDNEITKCTSTIDELTSNMDEYSRAKLRLAENQVQLSELAKEKERNEKLKQKLEESSLQVTTLHGTLQEKEHRLREVEDFLQQQHNDDTNSKLQLQASVQELQQQIANYTMQLQENNLHINSLTEEIESYKVLSNHVQTKDTEIQRLNNLIEEKQRDHEYALENQLLESQSVLSGQIQELDSLRRNLNQTEITRDEIVSTKDAEIDAYREQLDEVNKQLAQYQAEYSTSQEKFAQVTGQISEYEQHIAEYERQRGELNAIIENQVLKIEELHREIYEKSSNYDALVAELDEPQELQKKQVHFNESTSTSSQGSAVHEESRQDDDNPGELISRAELDLALYMLHQRDVRCEELTVELMQLLEERDTLQLRLSNALREKEDIRSRIASAEDVAGPASTSATESSPTGGKTKAIILGATGTEMATEAKEGQVEGSLANKLSELRVVGYRKDKTLVDEQELRRFQQMAILEHHKDDVSKLPAEAQARLLDASYTLSRDVQSPSKVLLNWLWGKSTPKVNNV